MEACGAGGGDARSCGREWAQYGTRRAGWRTEALGTVADRATELHLLDYLGHQVVREGVAEAIWGDLRDTFARERRFEHLEPSTRPVVRRRLLQHRLELREAPVKEAHLLLRQRPLEGHATAADEESIHIGGNRPDAIALLVGHQQRRRAHRLVHIFL